MIGIGASHTKVNRRTRKINKCEYDRVRTKRRNVSTIGL